LKKKLAGAAIVVVLFAFGVLGMAGIVKMARASNAAQVQTAVDKSQAGTIVETMRTCVMQMSTQGMTSQGVDQAHRLCWNRAELVGKKHRE
jgi:hypothetical protein